MGAGEYEAKFGESSRRGWGLVARVSPLALTIGRIQTGPVNVAASANRTQLVFRHSRL